MIHTCGYFGTLWRPACTDCIELIDLRGLHTKHNYCKPLLVVYQSHRDGQRSALHKLRPNVIAHMGIWNVFALSRRCKRLDMQRHLITNDKLNLCADVTLVHQSSPFIFHSPRMPLSSLTSSLAAKEWGGTRTVRSTLLFAMLIIQEPNGAERGIWEDRSGKYNSTAFLLNPSPCSLVAFQTLFEMSYSRAIQTENRKDCFLPGLLKAHYF